MISKVDAAHRRATTYRNSPARYGFVAQAFHWITAFGILAAYASIIYCLWILGGNQHPEFSSAINIHWVFGLSVGALVVPRLFWRKTQIVPDPPPGNVVEHQLAKITHWSLYFLMILMPLTGYLGTRRGTDFGIFFVPSFKDTSVFAWISKTWDIEFAQFEIPIDQFHHFTGRWVFSILIVLHISAALHHHFVRSDVTLKRMLPVRFFEDHS